MRALGMPTRLVTDAYGGEPDVVAHRNLGLVYALRSRFGNRARDNTFELSRPERLRCFKLAHAVLPCKAGPAASGAC